MLAFSASDQVVGDVFDDGEVGRGVSGSHAALVVAHHHVERPMQGVLDSPVYAHEGRGGEGGGDCGGEIEAGLGLDLVADLAPALDFDDALSNPARRDGPTAISRPDRP